MHRRRRSPISTIIILGIIGGIAFMIYDRLQHQGESESNLYVSSIYIPTTVPDILPSTPTPVASPQADIVNSSLFIPKAGILAPIIQVYLDGASWDVSKLGMNAGHLQGTAWLDSGPGNIVLSGHVEMADGRAGIFASIRNLAVGDLVIIKHGDKERRYMVTRTGTTAPDDLTLLYPSADDEVTLITCGDYDFFQNTYLERVFVVAERIS